MQFSLHVTCLCIVHAYVPFHFHIWYFILMVLFFFLSLSLSLFLSLSLSLSLSRIVCTWHLSANLLCPRTLFVPRHLFLILLLFTFGSMMRKPKRTSQRTSPDVVFIRSTVCFYRIFLILLYPLSFTIGDGNLYMRYL